MSVPIQLPTLTCPKSRCGYIWTPRIANPVKCPKCHNYLEPPKRATKEEKEQEAQESQVQKDKEEPIVAIDIETDFDGTLTENERAKRKLIGILTRGYFRNVGA